MASKPSGGGSNSEWKEWIWKDSPVEEVLKVLCKDNERIITEVFHKHPVTSAICPKIDWKTRVVFGDNDLEDLIVKHVLNDAGKWNSEVFGKMGSKNFEKDDSMSVKPEIRNLGICGKPIVLSKTFKQKQQEEASNKNKSKEWVALSQVSGTEVELLAEEYELEKDEAESVIYFLRGSCHDTRTVCLYMKALMSYTTSTFPTQRHRLVFVPHCTGACERILQDEGILALDNITMEEAPLQLVPLDKDLLSLEYPALFKETHIDGLPSNLVTTVANSIHKLSTIQHAPIPRLQGLGPLAEPIIAKLMELHQKDPEPEANTISSTTSSSPPIYAAIVLDRAIDLITPLLTPLTYEGLIDHILHIQCQYVDVDATLLNPEHPHKLISLALNSNDTLYHEVSIQNVEKFGIFLQDQAKALKQHHNAFAKNDKNLSQIHEFVKQIPIFTKNLRSLTQHIHLAETIKHTTDSNNFRHKWHTERSILEGDNCLETIEDFIYYQQETLTTILKLLSLQSLTNNGIKSNKFEYLKKDILHTYGYHLLPLLTNLEKANFIKQKQQLTSWVDSTSSFHKLRNLLILINAEVSTIEPNDFAYVSSGYAPLTVRLIQAATQGWHGKDEALRELPGKLIDIVQTSPPETFAQACKKGLPPRLGSDYVPVESESDDTEDDDNKKNNKPVIMAYFVGGISYMELAAIRFLNRRATFPFYILCCTTKIINGDSFLESLH